MAPKCHISFVRPINAVAKMGVWTGSFERVDASTQRLLSLSPGEGTAGCGPLDIKCKFDTESLLPAVIDQALFNAKRKFDFDLDIKPDVSVPLFKRARLCELELSKPKPKKSVRFIEKITTIHVIPAKEETWPYGSILGNANGPIVPKEFRDLYSSEEVLAASDAAFADLKASVGRCFLLYNGTVVRAACATKGALWGKVFMPFRMIASELGNSGKGFNLRDEDFLETDMYMEVFKSDVAEVCRMSCVSDKAKREPDTRTFFFAWYFCRESKSVLPYLEGASVQVFWPQDQKWYSGTVTDARKGLHRVVYDVDGSFEDLNLVSLKDEGALLMKS